MNTNLKKNILQTLVFDMFRNKCAIALDNEKEIYSHHYIPIYMRAQKLLIDIGFIKAIDCLYVVKDN